MRLPSTVSIPLLSTISVAAVVMLVGCTRVAGEGIAVAASAEPQLIGTVWQLAAYSDARGGMLPVLSATQPTALFQSTGFVTGSGGCNTYSTVFQSVASTLSVTGPITATHLVCEQPVMDQEAAYFFALARTASYRLEDGQLVLVQSGGAPLARYSH